MCMIGEKCACTAIISHRLRNIESNSVSILIWSELFAPLPWPANDQQRQYVHHMKTIWNTREKKKNNPNQLDLISWMCLCFILSFMAAIQKGNTNTNNWPLIWLAFNVCVRPGMLRYSRVRPVCNRYAYNISAIWPYEQHKRNHCRLNLAADGLSQAYMCSVYVWVRVSAVRWDFSWLFFVVSTMPWCHALFRCISFWRLYSLYSPCVNIDHFTMLGAVTVAVAHI